MHPMSAEDGEARTWVGGAVIWTASVLSAAAVIALTAYGLGATRRAAAQFPRSQRSSKALKLSA